MGRLAGAGTTRCREPRPHASRFHNEPAFEDSTQLECVEENNAYTGNVHADVGEPHVEEADQQDPPEVELDSRPSSVPMVL